MTANVFSNSEELFQKFFYNQFNAATDQEQLLEKVPFQNIVILEQVHGSDVVTITKENVSKKYQADALITEEQNVGLVIKVADCQAVSVYDPVQKKVANIHVGWRSLVQDIIPKTFALLGGAPRDYLVSISPSLGPCCSEFSDPFNELPEKFHHYIFKTKDQKSFVNLWKATTDQLEEFGLLAHNIERYSGCTKCSPEAGVKSFFSHRRGDRGRMVSIIGLL